MTFTLWHIIGVAVIVAIVVAVIATIRTRQKDIKKVAYMMDALEDITGVPMPENLRGLKERPVLHRDVTAPADMLAYVRAKKAEQTWAL